jgi:hypothetical protein
VMLNASLLVFALVSFELLLCSLAPTSFSHRGAGGHRYTTVANYLDTFGHMTGSWRAFAKSITFLQYSHHIIKPYMHFDTSQACQFIQQNSVPYLFSLYIDLAKLVFRANQVSFDANVLVFSWRGGLTRSRFHQDSRESNSTSEQETHVCCDKS